MSWVCLWATWGFLHHRRGSGSMLVLAANGVLVSELQKGLVSSLEPPVHSSLFLPVQDTLPLNFCCQVTWSQD